MPNLLAMSFDGDLAPSFDLRCLGDGENAPDGWGLAYYPPGEPSVSILKEAAPNTRSPRSELVRTWEHVRSDMFVLHIRRARWGELTDANTQPFSRAWGRRDWTYAHSGSLRERLVSQVGARFEPVGGTDTEVVFCELMDRIAATGAHSIGELNPEQLRGWLAEIAALGSVTSVLTDGLDLCVYADPNAERTVSYAEVVPPHRPVVFGDGDVEVDLSRRQSAQHRGLLVASPSLAHRPDNRVEWRELRPGSLLIIRQGAIRLQVDPPLGAPVVAPSVVYRPSRTLPPPAEVRRLSVLHSTTYRYSTPVEKSTHVLRLFPFHDRLQRVVHHQIDVSVDGATRDYEDVFGNRVRRAIIERPYSELVITSRSVVDALETRPFGQEPLRARSTIPLVWMPWQRHMLQPYLLPPELPESQLEALANYGMRFVERNDSDLVQTLLDLNRTIYEEYTYAPLSTTHQTTAFDVFQTRRGVCQDFTNLFICVARLLSIPARYACGYVYSGPRESRATYSEASHAWVQVYVPDTGWIGFDPTNGKVTQTEHVRMAVGRSWVDAAPTAGTIYVGGADEQLTVLVEVDQVG